ncbi:hypothetical protein M404DRAFT_993503 [Pisolithus tinctorius Marx 270]|uniref:Uncharacterized protein n=1 Tax=Pisolithus tinctorius Marx 270 TaxID=870435 RepID=A0A0C3PUM4_PISTI|nr:hypothetical protein M404DRAFT_993503 [Pisolithus tinctorius Marx 270]
MVWSETGISDCRQLHEIDSASKGTPDARAIFWVILCLEENHNIVKLHAWVYLEKVCISILIDKSQPHFDCTEVFEVVWFLVATTGQYLSSDNYCPLLAR